MSVGSNGRPTLFFRARLTTSGSTRRFPSMRTSVMASDPAAAGTSDTTAGGMPPSGAPDTSAAVPAPGAAPGLPPSGAAVASGVPTAALPVVVAAAGVPPSTP